MVEPGSKPPKERLPGLPPSDSDFWNNADINIQKMEATKRKPFYFTRTSGLEAKCSRTQVGYFLFQGQYVKDGSIYTKSGKKVI